MGRNRDRLSGDFEWLCTQTLVEAKGNGCFRSRDGKFSGEASPKHPMYDGEGIIDLTMKSTCIRK